MDRKQKKTLNKLKQYVNVKSFNGFIKTMLIISYLLLILLLIALPLITHFVIGLITYKIDRIQYTDYNITNICVTIMLSLLAVYIAVMAITSPHKKDFYLGDRILKNGFLKFFKNIAIYYLCGYSFFIFLNLVSSEIFKIANCSIVISLLLVYMIIYELILVIQNDSKAYYNVKIRKLLFPFPEIEKGFTQIEEYYKKLNPNNPDTNYYLDGNFAIILETDKLLKHIYLEKEINKKYSYLELLGLILTKLNTKENYEFSLCVYNSIASKLNDVVKELIKNNEIDIALNTTRILADLFLELAKKVLNVYQKEVMKFLVDNKSNIKSFQYYTKLIEKRFSYMFLWSNLFYENFNKTRRSFNVLKKSTLFNSEISVLILSYDSIKAKRDALESNYNAILK